MFTSFSSALSALNATSTAIDVVGNNLANVNTTGYKDSTVSFHDLVTQSLGAGLGETQVGFGTARPLTLRQFTQGAIQASAGPLDAAIQGDGFFVVHDPSTNASLFTRAGDFQVDANGNLLTSTGQHVQGWTATAGGTLNTNQAISDIQIPVGQLRSPQATQNMSLGMNLDANGVAGAASGTYSTTIPTVDSLGNPLNVTVTFTKDPVNPMQWNYQATVPDTATTGGTPGTPTPVGPAGSITFDAQGNMVSPAANAPVTIPINGLTDNAANMSITWSLYDSAGQPMITQFAQPSATSANSADGVPAAQLLRVGLADGGQLLAQYSNGTQLVVGQVALASVRNPESLVSVGQNNYQASAKTALPSIGVANTGGRGQILGGSLEASTVDIATEFTNLIVFQRAYQANSKMITTVDQLSQETINLKQ